MQVIDRESTMIVVNRRDMNILQAALSAWSGPYSDETQLNQTELTYRDNEIERARDMADTIRMQLLIGLEIVN